MEPQTECQNPKKRKFSQVFDGPDCDYHITLKAPDQSAHLEDPAIYDESEARNGNDAWCESEVSQTSGMTDAQDNQEAATHCFGALHGIAIRFRPKIPVQSSELSTTRAVNDGPPFVVLQVMLKADRGELQTAAGSCVAMLDSRTFGVFQQIVISSSLQVECVIPLHSLQRDTIQEDQIAAGCVYKVILNVYGSPADSDHIAASLSKYSLFLQDPECHQQDIEYRNPQYLDLPEELFSTQGDDNLNSCLDKAARHIDQGLDNINANDIAQEVLADIESNLELLVEQFAQHNYLLQASVDPRIKTDLLVHQKEGLDFLLRREVVTPNQARSLWEMLGDDRFIPSAKVYQHRITGAKSTTPEDSCGGILADDMGLGKSLMMISAIVASMAMAQNFAVSLTTPPRPGVEATVAAKTTLVIVPSALLMDSWADEITKHTHQNTLSYYKYHGHSRHIPLHELLQYDVILTTYGTVAIEHKRQNGPLFQVKWFRTVLDEAHMIRNSATIQFRAVSSIWSRSRWCLTGTPIQNSLDDLGSLVTFLGIPLLKEAAQFRRFITKKSRKTIKCQQPDFHNLQLLLGSVCLRRNKTIMPFSRSLEHVDMVKWATHEREAYERYSSHWKLAIDMAVSGQNPKAAHQTVLEAVLRMRMFCNHGTHYNEMKTTAFGEVEEMGSLLQQKGEAVCHYCSCDVLSFSTVANGGAGTVTFCQHAICGECLERYEVQFDSQKLCPICKDEHASPTQMASSNAGLIPSHCQEYPAKVKMLCLNIQQHVHESKSIVFSFWRKSLDIVGSALEDQGIGYLRVDGTIPFGQRKRILLQFQAAEQGMVLLMTLGTGAVGLNNLCVANRVHILEPQWNPSIESQAIGRVMRLGQAQTVHVTRYIVESSIEGSVQNGQLQKLQLARGGFSAGKVNPVKHKMQLVKDLICPKSVAT